jgi:hypothetical protein
MNNLAKTLDNYTPGDDCLFQRRLNGALTESGGAAFVMQSRR